MTNGRNGGRGRKDAGRDPGGFLALPWSVLDSAAYRGLSHPARALLLEFGRQCVKDNNGRLLGSCTYLRTRGWSSRDVVTRAKRELLEAGFIFETVKGFRPNRASWYAVTWRSLDRLQGFDPGAAAAFERGAYLKRSTVPPHGTEQGHRKIDVLRPPHGTVSRPIVPARGTERPLTAPPHGTVGGTNDESPVPSGGLHLEKPSVVASLMPVDRHVEQPAVDPPTASWEAAEPDGRRHDDRQLKLEAIDVTLDWWARGARVPTAGQAETGWPTATKLHADCARQCLERGVRPPTLRVWGTAMGALFKGDKVHGAHGTFYRGFMVRQSH